MAEEEDDGREQDVPGQRAREFFRRMTGSPAAGVALWGVRWAEAIEFAKNATKDDGDDGWTPIGPRNVGGSVRALAQDPDRDHASTFYAGTAGGGLWRTTDDGHTWEPLGRDDFGVVPVNALAVAPSDRRVIYVGTGEAWQWSHPGVGLFRSEDTGATFTRLASPGSSHDGDADHYTRICVDPLRPRTMWVASERGLWRFNNTSATQELNSSDYVTDLAVEPDPTNNDQLILLAGIWQVGVRRGVYNRKKNTTTWAAASPLLTTGGAPAANVGRVRVAIARSNPRVAYALVHDLENGLVTGSTGNGMPQALYASADGGRNFRQPAAAAAWPADGGAQAWYSMMLEVHPDNPQVVVAGHVNLYQSVDGGTTWIITDAARNGGWITWQHYASFDRRAEHADMHALVFDRRDRGSPTPRVWLGNDGGISFTDQWPPAAGPPPPGGQNFNWRKRSYGILGGQVVDVGSHPRFPSLVGCGMQDNGTFIGFGGPTWHMLDGGDGAALAWHPTNPRLAFTSWQNHVDQLTIAPVPAAAGDRRQPLPEVAPPNNNLISRTPILTVAGLPPPNDDTGVFHQIIEGDPATPNRLVVAAQNNAFYSTLGTSGSFAAVLPALPAPAPPPVVLAPHAFTAPAGGSPEVSAMAFVPGVVSNTDIWIGTNGGDIFTPPPAPGQPWTRRTPFTATAGGWQPWISSIAIHPARPQVVAVSAFQSTQRVMLTHDGGQRWFSLAGSGLPDAPVTSVAWHPTDEKVLYVGTLVGVFVARNLPAFVAAPNTATSANPTWKSFNRGLGPVLVNDLEVVPGTFMLRCASYGLGCFEASLRGPTAGSYATPAQYRVPAVRLSIRDHAMDDSRTYLAVGAPGTGPRALPDDPRLPPGALPPHMAGNQSIDIKVNAPELRDRTAYLQSERFGHQPDGAELDEQFVCENPISGDTNIAYVQVHNRGWKQAENVQVLLYVADAGAGGVAPPLTNLNFPNPPAENFAWQPAAPPQTLPVGPGQPRVVRFEWICPLEIQQNVALLAVCRSAEDEFAPAELPTGVALTWVTGERRAALRILPVVPDRIFIRDGLDDFGQRGAVAWGGRSPDIIVMTRAAADPITPADADNMTTGPFANLNDARRGDRVRQGNNTVFVRVHNRGNVAVSARVNLYRVRLTNLTNGAAWELINNVAPAQANNIPPRGWRMARIQLPNVAADPEPTLPAPWGDAYILVAVARSVNPVGGAELESFPDVAGITTIDELWNAFTRAPLANNAAMRALRFQAGAPPP